MDEDAKINWKDRFEDFFGDELTYDFKEFWKTSNKYKLGHKKSKEYWIRKSFAWAGWIAGREQLLTKIQRIDLT